MPVCTGAPHTTWDPGKKESLEEIFLCQERVGLLLKKNYGEFLDPFIYIYPNYTFTSVVKLGINSCSGLKKNKKAQKDISHSDTQVSLLNVGA